MMKSSGDSCLSGNSHGWYGRGRASAWQSLGNVSKKVAKPFSGQSTRHDNSQVTAIESERQHEVLGEMGSLCA
jgi:hypothetical protein